ncbi:sensor histidine kinase [Siminovitchia terrae]|uniref:Sensor histidine kinase n=1 Tax=Siminovitchia terrae TaxID=1914933 RepID=A0A429X5W2_SIMTE|nr:sensor histidine kinase [Siminovitchia terrae]RST58769.1 sensor histidine kinase [Siminovitchia terrae]GIN89949.1 sensor histidine kinase [Siminovitchia terrae]GIN94531.1 sensor histidine kinase [Siminovitchia terrae]
MKMARTLSFYFASLALFVFMFVLLMFLFTVDTDWYPLLMQKKYLLVPNVFFILAVCLLVGSIAGYIVGISIDKKVEKIEWSLLELEGGNYDRVSIPPAKNDNFPSIWQGIENIRARLKEQTLLYQKFTNERVKWNRELKEEVLTKERNRLARELHDSVSQQLFAATMLLSAINQSPDPTSEATAKQRVLVEEVINEAQSEMRALLLHLRPIQLEGKSLKVGMQELLSELTAKLPLKVTWNLQDVQLEKGIEDHLFRILQEAVSNTLRHAKAKTLEVHMMEVDQFVFLKVIDDGKGFNIGDQKAGSYGITNMRERASEIGGNIKIVSLPGRGTSIEVKIPLPNQEGG